MRILPASTILVVSSRNMLLDNCLNLGHANPIIPMSNTTEKSFTGVLLLIANPAAAQTKELTQ